MKKITSFRGTKKGDFLYWVDEDDSIGEVLSIIKSVNIESGKYCMREECYWEIKDEHLKTEKNGIELDRDDFDDTVDVFVLDEEEKAEWKTKITLFRL